MQTLVIYVHPHRKSHNHNILRTVLDALEENSYELLDLYAMKFNPLLSEGEWERMFLTKEKPIGERDVQNIQKKITDAKNLIFIYPVWWYNMPAILKGFCDRVFTPGFAYNFIKVPRVLEIVADIISFIPGVRSLLQSRAAIGHLKGKRAYIFRTYGGGAAGRRIFGNTVTVLENNLLKFSGITDVTICEQYNVNKPNYFNEERERKFLARVTAICKSIS